MAGKQNMDSKFHDSHITGKHPSSEDGVTKANTMQQTRVSVGSVTTAAAKCEMRSILIITQLSYRIIIAIILIYRIVHRSKTVFDIS